MISALTRLGLDPWHEAGRLSSLSKREAIEQLARLIAELPGACRPLAEARQIAGELVERLPKPGTKCPAPSQIKRPWRPWRQRWPAIPRQSQFFVLCIVVAAAALFSILLHRGF